MIIDEKYNKFNINKLPRNKYNRGSSTGVTTKYTIENSGITGTSTSTVNNFKPVYLWGNYFDDTQDITGSIVTSGDIEAKDIHATGNLIAGEMPVPYDPTETGCVYARNVNANVVNANDVNSTEVNTQLLTATTGTIDNLTSTSAIIDYLRSQEIRTHNLTVTGQAHFFELVIDKIKSVGGAVLLTPADGFEIEYIAQSSSYGHTKVDLLWSSTDSDGNKTTNMWENGDMCCIRDFNLAQQGISHNVGNRYFWARVNEAGTWNSYDIYGETKQMHYISFYLDSTEYDTSGSSPSDIYYSITDGYAISNASDWIGASCVMLGNVYTSDRQNAIYISAYDGLDDDLKAPFFATYKGIGTLTGTQGESLSTIFDLTHHKYSWFAAGTQTGSTMPANRIVGDLVVESTGQSVDEYVQAQIDATDINMYTTEVDNNIFFQPCDSNYSISNYLSFTATLAVRHNGLKWSISNIEFYLDGSTYYDHTQLNSKIILNYSTSDQEGTVTFDDSVIPYWYGDGYRYIDAVVYFYTNTTPQQTLTKTIRFFFYKLVQGQDGSGSINPYYIYNLIPVREILNVHADGTMTVDLYYTLGCAYEVNGSTEQTIVYGNVPTGTQIKYRDDRFQTSWQDLTLTNGYFVLTDNNYIQHTAPDGNVYTSYQDLTTHGYNPTRGQIYLLINNVGIDNRTIPFVFDNASVFQVKQDAITMAVSNSKTYTDQQDAVINNNLSSLSVSVGNINSQVQSHTAQLTGMSGSIVELQSDYNILNQWATGTQSTITSIEEAMDPVSGTLAYKDWTQSEINQSSTSISAVLRNKLDEAGIYIDMTGTDSKITLDADNTEVTGNLILTATGAGFSFKDEYNRVCLSMVNESIGVADTHVWNTNNINTLIGIDGMYSGHNGSYFWVGQDDIRMSCTTGSCYNMIKVDADGVRRYDNAKNYNGGTLSNVTHHGLGDISNTMTVRRINLTSNNQSYMLSRDDGFVVVNPNRDSTQAGYYVQLVLPSANTCIGTQITIKAMCHCFIYSSSNVIKSNTSAPDSAYNNGNGRQIDNHQATYFCDGINWYEMILS